jgi:hypothetical protein
MSPLRQRMTEDLRVRNYALKTQQIYLDLRPALPNTSAGVRIFSAPREWWGGRGLPMDAGLDSADGVNAVD